MGAFGETDGLCHSISADCVHVRRFSCRAHHVVDVITFGTVANGVIDCDGVAV